MKEKIGSKVTNDLRVKQQQQAKMKQIEKKQAAKLQKELQKATKVSGGEQTIILPEYEFDEQLSVYREVNAPNAKLFIPVGYNDQDTIRAIMNIREGGKTKTELKAEREEKKAQKGEKKVV